MPCLSRKSSKCRRRAYLVGFWSKGLEFRVCGPGLGLGVVRSLWFQGRKPEESSEWKLSLGLENQENLRLGIRIANGEELVFSANLGPTTERL